MRNSVLREPPLKSLFVFEHKVTGENNGEHYKVGEQQPPGMRRLLNAKPGRSAAW